MLHVEDQDFTLHLGDATEILKTLPEQSIDCVVTSPPYWGLRDYGADGQLGLESTPELYVAAMTEVFKGIWRVLKDTGTVWINLGDSYLAGQGGKETTRGVLPHGAKQIEINPHLDGKGVTSKLTPARGSTTLKPKDLCGMPWRVALALQADGWYLRSDIIWAKPNPMPESCTDRPTKSHEYIFLLTKRPHYFFNQDAVREPYVPDTRKKTTVQAGQGSIQHRDGERWPHAEGRNLRSVWTFPTANFFEAHFATFPEELVVRCLKAGCPEGGTVLDPFMGSGTTALAARKLGMKTVGIELNPEYAKICAQRTTQLSLLG